MAASVAEREKRPREPGEKLWRGKSWRNPPRRQISECWPVADTGACWVPPPPVGGEEGGGRGRGQGVGAARAGGGRVKVQTG